MHDYHVSVIEITYKPELGKIEISQKLFADDFEKALMLEGKLIKFNDDLNEESSKEALVQYLNKHFTIKIDGAPEQMKYLGAEWEDYHAFYIYWELEVSNSLEEITIINDVFLEVSSDQQNMHYISFKNKKMSLLLQEGKTKGSVKF